MWKPVNMSLVLLNSAGVMFDIVYYVLSIFTV
jgi:hypothetical protein